MISLNIIVISGSPRNISNTQIMMKYVYDYVKSKYNNTKFLNLSKVKIESYCGNDENYGEETKQAINDVINADVWLIGAPIYNSFFSAALKNLFEFIQYKNTAGKIAGIAIMASGKIGFIDVHTLLVQLMTYFKVITNPKAVYMNANMIKQDQILDHESKSRLNELADETIALAEKLKT